MKYSTITDYDMRWLYWVLLLITVVPGLVIIGINLVISKLNKVMLG